LGLFLAIGLLVACQGFSVLSQLPPLPQDQAIQAYFNHNEAKGAKYREPYRKIKRSGDNLEQIMIDAINSAQSTLDIAVQELRLPLLAKALVQQQAKGVRVRIIIEDTYHQPISQITSEQYQSMEERSRDRYQDVIAFLDGNHDGTISAQEAEERDALVILEKAEVPLIDDREDGTRGSGLMHHKFMIIDNQRLIVTSANFTFSDIHGDFTRPETRGNANNLLKIQSPELAQRFTDEFNLMWGDRAQGVFNSKFGVSKPARPPQTLAVGTGTVTVKFSPNGKKIPWEETSNALIAQTLQNSQKSTDLALFVFSEQKIANVLEERHEKGVKVEALIDPEFAFQSFSEGLDMQGVVLGKNCHQELDNQPWLNPIQTVGIPTLPKGDKLHHKMGVVDRNFVITGSHNWSNAANRTNDETLLVIQNPTVAAHYQREFDRLYRDAQLGLPQTIQRKVAESAARCATSPSRLGTASASNKVSKTQSKKNKPLDSNFSDNSSTSSNIINLNTATADELDTLPGIGLKLADRIVDERKNGAYTSLEDLSRVSGLGDRKIEKLRGKVNW
jgi:competence ComEA-like helix-hairpin-helix protein